MPKAAKQLTGRAPRIAAGTAKYDAHHTVMSKTYGALADLRRELSDSKAKVAERTELLNQFSTCTDSQRGWLLLEDYFDKLALSRKDFTTQEWWARLLAATGRERLEELAMLFMRSNRPLPNELTGYLNVARFAEREAAEREQKLLQQLEHWHFPPEPEHLDGPRARLSLLCDVLPADGTPTLHALRVRFNLFRPRTGERCRSLGDLLEIPKKSPQDQELFPPLDWDFLQWMGETYAGREDLDKETELLLTGTELLQWLARWGHTEQLELVNNPVRLQFHGQVAALMPHLENGESELSLTHRVALPDGEAHALDKVRFFAGRPPLVLLDHVFFLLRNAPPTDLLEHWREEARIPIRKLSQRFRTQLRRTGAGQNIDWDQLCVTHTAAPQFVFELEADTVRLRLLAKSERDGSDWKWMGHEWQPEKPFGKNGDKPHVLDDVRCDAATAWLRKLDWFTPEPGSWIGDANENFLGTLMHIWPNRPAQAEYLGNAAFHRLFLQPRVLKPKLIVKGSGIDWLAVSAEWEAEGLKLSAADLERLAASTSRFVKLPDAGWVQLDTEAVTKAHETMADLGVDGLSAVPAKLGLGQAAHLDEAGLQRFADNPEIRALKEHLKNFRGVPSVEIPQGVIADLRPYQKEGFEFLCHLTRNKLGGVLADDMGLGKTLQTLAWLAWIRAQNPKNPRPALVICPASVLHNWRREAERFTPHLKVLVLQSGAGRHSLRKQIPQHDLIVTNYALLRRDLEELNKFSFRVVVLDEAQFIKNPTAQVTQSVKQLKADQRLALTGTPLENRLLDLWSIVDFIQPDYLGDQDHFHETYEPRGEGEEALTAMRIARRRLSAKLRPLMIRRLKQQVAKDLPDRIEERRDCELGEAQRKLYLAELRRSRDQITQIVQEKGLGRSKMQVLAALTRLRQICCHPQLVGSDSDSGKTETLFELLEPLLAQGHKVLLFSQFVQMLKLIEAECRKREIPIHILTGETKERQTVVQNFQSDERPCVFLLSLRAAGTGLNLTTASYVVLYDPWWNPAVEAQAIDRSHRIGQTRTVNAYRLIAPGTVEEKIWDLQQRKAQTIADVLGEEGFARSLSQNDLEYLFSED
ncbi:MAG: DEAD/DEAH box helicase family protein [Verrucomicrobia bacterium]|nr:DEAD/DEAH box helicase family protein [Verrucomicrobiota bacterium]